MKQLIFGALLACFCAAMPAAAFADSRSPFALFAKQRGLALPPIVHFRDFVRYAVDYGMTEDDITGLFQEMGIVVRGGGDGRYMNGRELLRGCGADCRPDDGLGFLLTKFLRPADLNRGR